MARELVTAVPENVRKHLPPASSYSRIRFELSGSESPYVVMPELARRPDQLGRRVTGPSRTRIICLQSICNAKSWDTFLVGDSTLQCQLENVCRLLSTGRASQPKINLGSIYGAGIRGLVNNWVDYPFSLHDDPPPYLERDRDQEVAGVASKSSSGPELYWKTSPVPATLLHEVVSSQAVTTAKRKQAEAASSSSDEGAIVHKHPRQATSNSDSEPDRGGRMAAFQAQLALAQELSPTEADPESTPPDELHYKMVHFILYSLRRDGDAIANYAKDFIEMGHNVNTRDDRAFRAVKHRCYNSLATQSARRGFRIPSTPNQISDQVKMLLDWLDDAISEEAYALVDRHYACLAEMAAQAEEGSRFVQEEFEIRRADFYAAAFCVADGFKRDCPRRPPTLCAEGIPRLSQAYRSFR
ncbi:hypothetical protein DBV05_g10262 [Lasiodiplodia theobromae]|uniref:Uncharacterized protein n=1 Tax=Lasiodiplodia theobromae TaxID=45133 RepID=A0A5N5D0D6_9PEZI|nr:hypothetical protein DBV05_g10262 [Lasiodiplodia theobromae]